MKLHVLVATLQANIRRVYHSRLRFGYIWSRHVEGSGPVCSPYFKHARNVAAALTLHRLASSAPVRRAAACGNRASDAHPIVEIVQRDETVRQLGKW